MPKDEQESSFKELEKQLAKDALEQALKSLHNEITQDIERNKKAFSEEISKTLSSFKGNLEQSVSEEINRRLSSLFEKHFGDLSLQVKTSFQEMSSPILKKIQADMQQLHTEGQKTLQTWKEAVSLYTSFWTKPAFTWMGLAIFLGVAISFVFACFIRYAENQRTEFYEKTILSQQETIRWYYQREKSLTTTPEQKKAETNAQSNNKAKNKKK